jgi:hypothetical protein
VLQHLGAISILLLSKVASTHIETQNPAMTNSVTDVNIFTKRITDYSAARFQPGVGPVTWRELPAPTGKVTPDFGILMVTVNLIRLYYVLFAKLGRIL